MKCVREREKMHSDEDWIQSVVAKERVFRRKRVYCRHIVVVGVGVRSVEWVTREMVSRRKISVSAKKMGEGNTHSSALI